MNWERIRSRHESKKQKARLQLYADLQFQGSLYREPEKNLVAAHMFLSDDEILTESRRARDGQMLDMSDERAEEILSQAKALIFTAWQGQGFATTLELAEFYEISVDAVESRLRAARDEFEGDGLKKLKGMRLKAFKDVSASEAETSLKTPQLIVWTPKAALRLGMLLTNSPIAKQVRTLLIEMVVQGGLPPQTSALQVQFHQALATAFPETQALMTDQSCSTLYTLQEYKKIERYLSTQYTPGIRGYSHESVVKEVVYLSAQSDSWALRPERELCFQSLDRPDYRYPDLISQTFFVQIGNQIREAIFVFEYKDPIVHERDVRECLYDRQYLDLTKRIYDADYVFLILFAPFGATPYAAEYVETSLPPEYQGFVRIMTTEEVFQFLNQQVAKTLKNGKKKAEITRNIKPLLRYEIPTVTPDGQIIRQLPLSSFGEFTDND